MFAVFKNEDGSPQSVAEVEELPEGWEEVKTKNELNRLQKELGHEDAPDSGE